MTDFRVPRALEVWVNVQTGERVRVNGTHEGLVGWTDLETRKHGVSPLRAFVHRRDSYFTREEHPGV